MATKPPKTSADRFPPTWEGFVSFRKANHKRTAPSTLVKYQPIIRRLEELRVDMFGRTPWGEIAEDDITYVLFEALLSEVRGRNGQSPSNNTLKGRHDACNAYFTFLVRRNFLASNPLDEMDAPKAEPRSRPSLMEDEDEALYDVEKFGHELAVYALARGCALREGEICGLHDDDVDLERQVVCIRDGKTRAAVRSVPLQPVDAVILHAYRRWRDANIGSGAAAASPFFIITGSGRISAGYVWKLVKAMANRAGLRPIIGDDGKQSTDKQGNLRTEVTPHSLRRTYGADYVRRGVATVVLAPVMGHASPRVTEASYCAVSKETLASKLMLSEGDSRKTLGRQMDWLEQQAERIEADASADPIQALERLNDLAAAIAAATERIGQLNVLTGLDTRNPANRPSVRQPQRSRGATRVLVAAAA